MVIYDQNREDVNKEFPLSCLFFINNSLCRKYMICLSYQRPCKLPQSKMLQFSLQCILNHQ